MPFRPLAFLALLLVCGFAPGQPEPKEIPKKDAAKEKAAEIVAIPPAAAPSTPVYLDDRFRQSLAANTQQTSSVTPNMFADAQGNRPGGIQIPGVNNGNRLRIPNPAAAGVVGRVKAAEDNSPLPRDRVLFNFDSFRGVPLGQTDWEVQRYQVGFEKTFLDQRVSIEARLPFAQTLDSTFSPDAERSNTELGNLRLTLKALPWRGETFSFAGGLAMTVPTADSTVQVARDGSFILQVRNQATLVEPYIAALWTPNETFFAQVWGAYTFDPLGNPITINPALLPDRSPFGRLHEVTVLSLDAQVGFWLFRHPEASLRGLAPILELHYNGAVSNGTVVNTRDGSTYQSDISGLNELNVTIGLVADFANNLNLGIGAVLPMRDGQNRTFDYQIGMRLNWFFGPTARARDYPAAQVPSF